MTEQIEDPACAVAHDHRSAPPEARTLVVVFASPVAEYLLRYGNDVGFSPVLLEPDPARAAAAGSSGLPVAASFADCPPGADVVVTDHHRPELGVMLRDALAARAGWIGLMGSPRHPGPHIPLLTELGVAAAEIARVHRPIGLNIGSRAPAEIAIATVAGLIAERNGCPGGFSFSS
ncbi:MAG TPA: XdhC family protein [Streptosporangiaceae bacterium]|jgi:xanthine/CO dehydrogenase XdhC/CoxF family maturation factor